MFKMKEFLASVISGDGADDPAQLASAVHRLGMERVTAVAEIERLASSRVKLLLADDDAGLDKLDRQSEAQHRIVEKADLARDEIERRLAVARANAHAVLIDKHVDAARALRDELHRAAARVIELNAVARSLHEEASREIGFVEARSFIPNLEYGAGYSAGGLAHWLSAINSMLEPASSPGTPPGLLVVRFRRDWQIDVQRFAAGETYGLAAPVAKVAVKKGIAEWVGAPPSFPADPRDAPAPEPSERGTILVRVVNQFSVTSTFGTGVTYVPGETVALPAAEATKAVRGGFAQFSAEPKAA